MDSFGVEALRKISAAGAFVFSLRAVFSSRLFDGLMSVSVPCHSLVKTLICVFKVSIDLIVLRGLVSVDPNRIRFQQPQAPFTKPPQKIINFFFKQEFCGSEHCHHKVPNEETGVDADPSSDFLVVFL